MRNESQPQTVGRMATDLPHAIDVFERHHIDYAFHGSLSLRDACAEAAADFEKVQKELNALTISDRDVLWSERPLRELTGHIEKRHHAFTRAALRDITAALTNALHEAEIDADSTFVHIRRIFFDFRDELLDHMRREEELLFPYVRLIETAVMDDKPVPTPYRGTFSSPAAHSVEEHEHAAQQIESLQRLVAGIARRGDAPHVVKMQQLLAALARNLREHMHLENNVLFARAIDYERGGNEFSRFDNPLTEPARKE